MTINISTTTALQVNQILRQSTLILMSIIMTKWGVSIKDIGIYETFMFVSYTVSFFWITAFLQGILTHYPSILESEKPSYTFNIFLIFNALSIFIFLMLYFFPQQSLFILTAKSDTQYFNIFTLYLLFFLPPYMLESVWAVENRPLSILIVSIITNVLLLFCVIYPIHQNRDFLGCFYIMVIVALLRYIILIFNVMHRGNFTFSIKIIKDFLKITTPLMGYAFVGGFITAVTTWLISWYYVDSFEQFAIYRFGAREFPIINAMTTGLSSGLIPLLIQKFDKIKVENELETTIQAIDTEGLSILKEKTLRLWHILFPMTIVLMFSSKTLFGLVFNEQMIRAVPIFNVFLLLLISRALFPQTLLMVLKETKVMFRMSLIESLCIVVMGFAFIYLFGMIGVAWSMVLGFLIEKIMMVLFLKKKFNINFKDYTHVNYYLFYTFALIVSYLISI
jgi:O-antigen/teichoic acid export membrane protein